MTHEKITEAVKLHLNESLLRAVQDAALDQDRSVSEFIRHALTVYLYGTVGAHLAPGQGANRGEEGRQ